MKTFKDNTGKTWKLDVTVGSLMEVKDTLDIDLIENPNSMPSDIQNLIAILYIHLEEQITEGGLNERTFTKRLTGSVLKDAVNAFTDELVAFFLEINPPLGEIMKKQLELFQTEQNKIVEEIKQVTLDTSSEWQDASASTQEDGNTG